MSNLPNRLKSGDVIVTASGHRCKIVRTSETDQFDQPRYRLRHPSGVVGSLALSRDELAEKDCTLITEQEVTA